MATKEKIAEWSQNYLMKHKTTIAERRRVKSPRKNNSDEVASQQAIQAKNKAIFDKSYFGQILKEQRKHIQP